MSPPSSSASTVNNDPSTMEKGDTTDRARHEADAAEKRAAPTAGAPGGAGASKGGPPTTYTPAVKNLIKLGVLLIVTFWIVALWLFGSYYKMTEHLHKLGCVVVDLDGGSVGSALLTAVGEFNGLSTSLHYDIKNSSTFTLADARQQVYDAKVWCALVANAGATDAFTAATASGSTTTSSYDAASAYTYIGSQARYPSTWSGFVLPAITNVLTAAERAFAEQTVSPALAGATTGEFSAAQIGVLLNPVSATFEDVAPFKFANTALLNTIGMVLPQLFQFFFLLGLNGLFNAFKLYRFPLKTLVRDRLVLTSVWTLLTSLCVTGWTLAFVEGWSFPAKNFFALWAVNWVFALVTFDLFDILTAFVPPQLVAMPIISIIIMTVASTASPIELDQQFFRVHWAFPGHAVWLTQIVIYGRGAGGSKWLHITLPILAAWLVVARLGSIAGLRKRRADHHRSSQGAH